jgi:tRNA (guanine26-N2/guanine27-N2)-dimethyltransferase
MHREITPKPFSSLQCPECGARMDYAGPLWTGSIVDAAFVGQMLVENQKAQFKNSAKINKLLTLIKGEAIAPATYYVIDKLSGKLNLPAPSNQAFIAALQKGGYQAVPTHFNPRGIKTNAQALDMHRLLKGLVP